MSPVTGVFQRASKAVGSFADGRRCDREVTTYVKFQSRIDFKNLLAFFLDRLLPGNEYLCHFGRGYFQTRAPSRQGRRPTPYTSRTQDYVSFFGRDRGRSPPESRRPSWHSHMRGQKMIVGFLKYRTPRPPRRQPRRAFMSVTQLEMRLAPATLVSPTLVTYLNEHFQVVDVQVSQPVFNATTINQVFTFNSGSVNGSNASKQQLQLLDLTQLTNPSAASGATLTIKVISGSPDVEVGFIKATGIALGAVTVQGNLGGIDAGDGVTTPGLASLSVQTMGAYGTTTQAPGSLESDVLGPLGVLTVVGNIDGAFINVSGGSAGTIGQVNVGGSLVGGAADYSGEISASGDVGDVGGVTV